MNWLDFTIGVLLLIAMINGFRKGLVMQLVALATIVLSAIFGGQLAKKILPELTRLIDLSPNVAHVLSYVIAFIGIAIVISLIGRIIQKFIQIIFLSFINRLLGSVVALATMMIFLSILLNLALMLDKEEVVIRRETKEASFFFERVEAVVPAIVPYLNQAIWKEYAPKRYREEIEAKSDSLNQFAPSGAQIDSTYQQRHFEIN